MTCGKTRYSTPGAAEKALRGIRKFGSRGENGTKPQRVYACPRCHGWHLTSRSHS